MAQAVNNASIRWILPLGALFLAALWLRWPYPEPAWTHIDERAFIEHPLGFFSGDFNPRFFNYPTLPFYLSSAIYYLYYLLFSTESLDAFIAYRFLIDPSDLLLIARSLMTIVSAATVVVVFFIARQLYGTKAGLVASGILATMPLHVRFSHLAITDVLMTLCIALAVLFATRITCTARRSDYLWAGIFTGLAAASKYPGALVAVAVIAAAWPHRPPWKNANLWFSGLLAILIFALTSPYIWLDFNVFWTNFTSMGHVHLAIPVRHDASSLFEHFRFGLGHIGLLSTLLAIAWKPRSYSRKQIALIASILIFVLLICSGSAFMRYGLPLAPLIAVLIARLVALMPSRLWLGLWLLLLLSESTWHSWQTRRLLSGPDTREEIAVWLDQEHPQGTRIAHLPGGSALRLPLLDQLGIFARFARFSQNFGNPGLVAACALLSTRVDLPSLFFSWDEDTLLRYGQNAAVNPSGRITALHYFHPIVNEGAEQAPEGFIERAIFAPGDLHSAVFDRRDWYYLPIGHNTSTRASGPRIRAGHMPFLLNAPLPTTPVFMQIAGLLIACKERVIHNEWQQASRCYQSLLDLPFFLPELLPKTSLYEFYMEAALSLFETGALAEALAQWQQAAQLHPERPWPHFNMATAHLHLGQIDRAVSHYEAAIVRDPQEPDFLYALALAYVKQERFNLSLDLFERVIQQSPTANAYINKGMAHGQLGQLKEQLRCFAEALKIEPEHPLAPTLRQTLSDK